MKSDLTITSGTRVPVERVAALDTLRGIALLMVISAHFLPGKLIFGLAANVVSTMGRGGVILFFVKWIPDIQKSTESKTSNFSQSPPIQDFSGLLWQCFGYRPFGPVTGWVS